MAALSSLNSRRNILYVEDDPAAVMLFKIALGKLHMAEAIDLHTVDDATQALALLQQNQLDSTEGWPDLIILDLHLPRRDGISLLREIRDIKLIPDVPVVFFTASRSDREEKAALQLGALAFLHKALDLDRFVNSVKMACSYLPA